MLPVQIKLLGPFQVLVDNRPATGFLSDKVRALLAYLAVEEGRPHRREALAGLLWPEQSEQKARANLRRALANLRRVIHDAEGHYLQITRQTLQLPRNSAVQIDAHSFSRLLADPEPTIAQLEKAASYVGGRFLAGFSINDSIAFEEWALIKREQFQQLSLDCLHRLTRHYERYHQFELALHYARQQVHLEPWHESGQRQLLRLLAYTGQRATAITHFERFQAELAAELDIAPETATGQLADQIRAGTFVRETHKQLPFLTTTPGNFSSPFVAREDEMERLFDHLQRAAVGQGRVVFITGEAGSGKTRLMHTFAQEAQKKQPQLIPLFGECPAHTGRGAPYLPFRALLSQLAGNLEPLWQNGTLNRAQVNRLWALRDPAAELLISVAPDLIDTFVHRMHLPTAPEKAPTAGPAAPQLVLFEQLTHLLQCLSQHGPLLLLLDDLQWADKGTLDLILHLGRQLTGYPVLLVGAYRPEEITTTNPQRHPLVRVFNECTERFGEIEIALNQAPGRAFIDAWLDWEPNCLDAAFRQTLYQQTKGQALFTVELVAQMKEQGDLVRDSAGYWRAGEQVHWDRMPARVEAVIAERIGRLPDSSRRLLATAAIQGESFLAEVVAQIHDLPLAETIQQLSSDLVRAHQLVLAQGRQWVGGRSLSTYRFRHQLFQAYLYGRLDDIERASGHEATGAILEQIFGAEMATDTAVAGRLAWHFAAGGRPEKAIHYSQMAGTQALQLSAHEEAVTHFRQALALLAKMPETDARDQQEIDLQLALGAAWLPLKGYAASEVREVYDRARDLCQKRGTEPQLVTALFWLSSFYAVRGDLPQALNIARQMLDITKECALAGTYTVMAHLLTGLPLFFMGELKPALRHLEQALAAYDPDRDRELVYQIGQELGISAHIWSGHVLLHMGEVESAQDHLNTALAMLAGLEHAHTEAFTILLAGGTPFMTPYPVDLDKSLAYCRQALAVATRGHLAYFQTISQFYVSFVQAQMAIAADRPDKAEILQETTAQMENCLQVETQIGSQLGTSSRYIELARLYGHLGEMETAFQLLNQAVEIINTNQEHYFAPELYQVKGDLCLAQNDPAAAERCYQQALNIARQQSADWWVLKVGRSLSAGIHDLRQPGQGVRDGGGNNGPGLPGQPGQVEA